MLSSREAILSPSSHNNIHSNHASIAITAPSISSTSSSSSGMINTNNSHANGGISSSLSLSSISPIYDRDTAKYDVHNHRRSSKSQWVSLGIALAAVISFIMFVFLLADKVGPPLVHQNTSSRDTLSIARQHRYTNCSNIDGVTKHVRDVAHARCYLHQFEYERLHPCCVDIRSTRDIITADDIVFVVQTEANTRANARHVLDTWASSLPHVLLVSNVADASLGTIVLERGQYPDTGSYDNNNDNNNNNNGNNGGDHDHNHNDDSNDIGNTDLNIDHRQIWALKYIAADHRHANITMSNKKWFFITDDSTWVNIPSLLSLLSRYNHRCAIMMGSIWSVKSSLNDAHATGNAGILLSHAAFTLIAHELATSTCPYQSTGCDRTISLCAWTQSVQLVHNNAFSYNAPHGQPDHTTSNGVDPNHSGVFLPPLAEAITYHLEDTSLMAPMTIYANQRWAYNQQSSAAAAAASGDNTDSNDNDNDNDNGSGVTAMNATSTNSGPILLAYTMRHQR